MNQEVELKNFDKKTLALRTNTKDFKLPDKINLSVRPAQQAASERGQVQTRKQQKKLEVSDAETRMKRLKSKMFDQINGLMTVEEKKQYLEAQKEQLAAGGISAAPQRSIVVDKEAEEKQLQLKCCLCKRNRPVFAGDEDMKRLPEAALNKFLKVLRADTLKKQRYLSQLRITPKFIQACSCPQSICHSYCLTAKIIQTKRIFCVRCDEHFKLHLSKHMVSVVGSVIRYIFIICCVIALGLSVCMLDGFLKCRQSGADGKRTFTSRHSLVGSDGSFLGFMEDCVDLGSVNRI